jgi:hypothetical protein
MNALMLFGFARRRQITLLLVHPPVSILALDRISRFCPLALDPFEIRQTRAVLELVHHPGRQERQVPGQFRERKRQISLDFVGVVHGDS